jgi:aryl-alcohol dehydrogenase-like predicted oxidoreductase
MQLLLGTANFSKKYRLSSEEPFYAQQLLVTAFENGINCLDVSDAYDGAYYEIKRSEISWNLNAKIVLSDSPGSYLKEINQKVIDLSRAIPKAHINSLMIHNGSKLSKSNLENALDAMRSVGEKFGVSNIGLSLYPDDEDKIMFSGVNTLQVPVNVLDQRIFTSSANSDNVKEISNVQARSIFLRGLLSTFNIPQPLVDKLELDDVKFFHEWCKSEQVNPTFACINFVYHLSFIDSIVIGVNSTSELINNLNAVDQSKRYKLETDFRSFKSANIELIDPRRWGV